MTHQGTVEASTRGRADDYLLAHHLDGRLDDADSLLTAAQLCIACIPSAYDALRNLGTFSFVALHLFSAAGRHASAVAELLCLIDRLSPYQYF